MKNLAFVKLTKNLVSKVKDKVAAKKRVWAEEAALSVEENKRREAEFKEDFKFVKERVTASTEKAKQSIESTIESGAKVEEKKQTTTQPEVKKEPKPEVKVTKEAEKIVEKEVVEKKSTKEATPKKTAVNKAKSEKPAKESVKPKARVKVEKEAKSKEKVVSKAKTATKTESGSKKEAKIALYSKDITKHYGEVDEAFLAIVVKNLGPSIYKKDAESVACSDPKELETVRKNFLVKKLGMSESQEVLDKAIKEVCEEMKASRKKYRASFYYALAKKLKQESKLS